MAKSNEDYCAANGIDPNQVNVLEVDRIRRAGAWLRNRAYRRLRITWTTQNSDGDYLAAVDASHAFEQRACKRLAARTNARDRQLMSLRLASPMRPVAGRTADVDGLALFDAVRQPSLF